MTYNELKTLKRIRATGQWGTSKTALDKKTLFFDETFGELYSKGFITMKRNDKLMQERLYLSEAGQQALYNVTKD